MATHRINHHGSDDSLDNVVEQHANKRLKKFKKNRLRLMKEVITIQACRASL